VIVRVHLDYQEALDRVLDAGGHTSRQTGDVYATLLGAVHGWKTGTSEQLAAVTGRQDLWSGATTPYATTIAAGPIDLGHLFARDGVARKLVRPRPLGYPSTATLRPSSPRSTRASAS
jgi:hypothetical protein